MTSPMRKPEGISWQAASVELPQIPMVPPGEDAMSATIAEALPALTAPLNANVAALAAKENMFSGKVGVAQTAYEAADQSGGESVGQLTSMLGQVGQMGQMAQTPMQAAGQLSGQTGMFGSLMQQAMQGAQGGGAGGGAQGAPAATPAGGAGMAGGPPPAAAHGGAGQENRPEAPPAEPPAEHQERETPQPAERLERAEVGPDDGRDLAGPAPVTPPESPGEGAAAAPGGSAAPGGGPAPSYGDRDDEDLARRM